VARRKPSLITTGRLQSLRLFSTLLPFTLTDQQSKREIVNNSVQAGIADFIYVSS